MDMSVASVNSALQRARAGFRRSGDPDLVPLPHSEGEGQVVDRFVDAFQQGDVDQLVALLTDDAKARLQALVDSTDGFELAEKDLELRGEGQLLGTRQSGLSDLRFVRLRADRPILEAARRDAEALVDHEGPLNDEVERFFAERDVSA